MYKRQAKHGIDINEARDAYANADAQENAIRTAYRGALAARSRDGYQTFLTQFGRSLYAPDVRQRLAACRVQTQTTGGTQQSQMARNATGSGNTTVIACDEARNAAQGQIENACVANRGRLGAIRITGQNSAMPLRPAAGWWDRFSAAPCLEETRTSISAPNINVSFKSLPFARNQSPPRATSKSALEAVRIKPIVDGAVSLPQ